ncbi:helicase HerA domain-containing protein [Cryptosporangium sp. NPDC048952]|uniref:helicase HerA domain-containing protein n=1 Tax=Cryptosporangium sp. NPDC048952 TaxID=3363961 RepID=UPI0037141143
MTDIELRALRSVRIHFAPTPDDVWNPNPFHVDGMHQGAIDTVLDGLEDAFDSDGSSPIGVIIQGQRGTGKTHLMGWLRDQIQDRDGYFFLLSLVDPNAFWPSAVVSILDGLTRKVRRQMPQRRTLLTRLASDGELAPELLPQILGDEPLTPPALTAFIRALQRVDDQIARDCQDTARALVLYGSADLETQDIGQNFLHSHADEAGYGAAWGIGKYVKDARLIVRDLSRLLALTGPSVIGVDQIDPIITAAASGAAGGASGDGAAQNIALDQIAEGLMSLRENTRRTLTVLTCSPTAWTLITDEAIDAAQDRFREAPHLNTIPTEDFARALIAKRFERYYRRVDFEPPYPTWPVAPGAFQGADKFTPRELLKRVDKHVRACVDRREVVELTTLADRIGGSEPKKPPLDVMTALDARFEQLIASADVSRVLDPSTEDAIVPRLLNAGLEAWILEKEDTEKLFSYDPLPGIKPPLHARLRMTLDERTEDEAHWAFRAIGAEHLNGARPRIQMACMMSGLSQKMPKRRLFLLRNAEWHATPGTKTWHVLEEFKNAGGRTLPVSQADLAVLSALRVLLDESPNHLETWLEDRRPSERIEFLREALSDLPTGGGPIDVPQPDPSPLEPRTPLETPAPGVPTLVVGRAIDDGGPVSVELEALRKHTAIFAGSGSGKTVLIRRLVEECALQGVSSIVLDPNNDLARLGDAWPKPPSGWGDGDAAKASDYLSGTDVVIWTPRRQAGRALSFQPLPDFASVREDPDEFDAAIDAAVATLAPRARADGGTARSVRSRAVLTEALRFFARSGFSTLREFIGVLAAFPEDASRLENADKIAAELAQDLNAAVVNDPLFGGSGAPVDPGVLLTPAPGKRARVSVISLVGLPSDEQRQSFVNQLQMALFAWVKKNPVGDRPLGGLFVMDEAQTLAPSGAMTACTQSTLALASQARKYGLGLVFATQAPKGLHNRIPGNAATQFFGLLNAPAQISAAQEMAKAKGGSVPDVGRMRTGEFYAAPEGSQFVKVKTPLCLSYHPKSPLTTEEVVERAHAGA